MEDQVARAEVSAVEAAIRLALSRERVIRLIQTGKLAGRRDQVTGWRVYRDALDRALESAAA